jgi:hypothetical protein
MQANLVALVVVPADQVIQVMQEALPFKHQVLVSRVMEIPADEIPDVQVFANQVAAAELAQSVQPRRLVHQLRQEMVAQEKLQPLQVLPTPEVAVEVPQVTEELLPEVVALVAVPMVERGRQSPLQWEQLIWATPQLQIPVVAAAEQEYQLASPQVAQVPLELSSSSI